MKYLVCASIFASATCLAQTNDVSFDVCERLARDRLMDKSSYMSAAYNYQQHYEHVCRQTGKGTSAKFGLASSVAAVVNYVPVKSSSSIDANYRKEYLEGYCRHIGSISEDQRNIAFTSQTFSSNMQEVVSKCFDVVKAVMLEKSGVFAYATPNNSVLTEYLVSVEVRPRPATMVKLQGVSGVGTTCEYKGKPLEVMDLISEEPKSFICRKPHDEGTYLTVYTSMGDTAVRLPGQTDQKLIQLQAQIDALATMLDRESKRQIVLEDCDFPIGEPYTKIGHALGVEGQTNMWNNLDHVLRADCPSGQVIVGVHSGHLNGYEDRQFRYKCCSIKIE